MLYLQIDFTSGNSYLCDICLSICQIPFIHSKLEHRGKLMFSDLRDKSQGHWEWKLFFDIAGHTKSTLNLILGLQILTINLTINI